VSQLYIASFNFMFASRYRSYERILIRTTSFSRSYYFGRSWGKLHRTNNVASWAIGCVSAVVLGMSMLSFSASRIGVAECYGSPTTDGKNAASSTASLLTRNFVADVVEDVSPTVVNIVCVSNRGGFYPAGASSGSGFIITKDGFIVTNAHVVSGAVEGNVIVTLNNGRKIQGFVHSADPASDIALVKVDLNGEELPFASMGHSTAVRAGELVIAIGSPMMLQNSASVGIISAAARHASELGMANNRAEYLQTDAAINSGNSGGPLVNLDGQVIGICSIKVKGTDGISFAIPMSAAFIIINQLIRYKKFVRPYVGLKMGLVVDQSADSGFGTIPSGTGTARKGKKQRELLLEARPTMVMVLEVARGSPAYLAGIERSVFYVIECICLSLNSGFRTMN
jgi:S1-C subfamily serine protease